MTARVADTPDSLRAALGRLVRGARSIRAVAGPLLPAGLAQVLCATGNARLQLLVASPDGLGLDALAASHTHPEDLARAASRAGAAPGGERIAAARLALARALAACPQTAATRTLLRAAAERLRAGGVELRVIAGCPPATRWIAGDAQRALVMAESPLLLGADGSEHLATWVEGDDARALEARFEALWGGARSFGPEALEQLEACWALLDPSPFDVYLKLMQHYADWGRAPAGDELLWDDEVMAALTEFQRDAVRHAARMIHRYGGCFVADVVGLGKSFVGAALLKLFERTLDLRALIVCPAPLVPQWEAYVERFELAARVVSMGQLTDGSSLAPALRLETPELRSRQLVLVDESHAFRNAGTQRYDLLQAFLSTGRRVVLLTATPMNRAVRDVLHQLRLFHPEDRTQLPITPPHLERFFRLVEGGHAHLPDLLGHVLVRRTRRDVIRLYGRDAETGERVTAERLPAYLAGARAAYVDVGESRQVFPRRRLATVDYSLERTYDGLYAQLRRAIAPARPGEPGGLAYAYYDRGQYLRPDQRARYPSVTARGKSLAGLIRVLLFKRLESSVEALRATLRRMIAAHEQVATAASGVLSGASPLDADEGDDVVDARELLEREVRWEDLDADRFVAGVHRDLTTLRELEALVRPITPARDAKLEALRALLRRHEGQKVLVFTQFADTAEYLGQALAPDLGDALAVATSQRGGKARVAARFAPRANAAFARPGGPELRVLVATDVLAEGLNLQDCNVVVNYDLHWNPVRLIQRFGRVDRIGTDHAEILAYNFLPEAGLEANLGLQARLRTQIAVIHEVLGEDAPILEPGEALHEQAFYAIYEGDVEALASIEAGDGLVDGSTVDAEAALRNLAVRDPDRVHAAGALPDGVQAAFVAAPGTAEGVAVLLRAEQELRLAWVSQRGEVEQAQPGAILERVACTEHTAAVPLPPWVGDAIEAARRHFREELDERLGDLLRRRRHPKAQREVLERLAGLHARDGDLARVDLLRRSFDQELPRAVVRRLTHALRGRPSDEELLRLLGTIYHDHGLGRLAPQVAADRIAPIQVVCSVARVVQGPRP